MVALMTSSMTIQCMSPPGETSSSVHTLQRSPWAVLSTETEVSGFCLGPMSPLPPVSGLLLTCPLLSSWGTRAQPSVPDRVAEAPRLLQLGTVLGVAHLGWQAEQQLGLNFCQVWLTTLTSRRALQAARAGTVCVFRVFCLAGLYSCCPQAGTESGRSLPYLPLSGGQ